MRKGETKKRNDLIFNFDLGTVTLEFNILDKFVSFFLQSIHISCKMMTTEGVPAPLVHFFSAL